MPAHPIKPWTEGEIAEVKRCLGRTMTISDIASDLGRSEKSVSRMAERLGVSRTTWRWRYRLRKKQVWLRTPEQADLAYRAGIIDGEGTITIVVMQTDYLSLRPQVIISNTSRELMDWIQALVNCTVRASMPKTGRSRVMQVSIHGWRAAEILGHLLPYLRIKKAQAQLLIDFSEDRLNQKIGEGYTLEAMQIFWKIRHLNLDKFEDGKRFKRLVAQVRRKNFMTLLQAQVTSSQTA